MYNCDEKLIIKFDADFNEDFDSVLLDLIGNCKRLYFMDTKGFGLRAKPANSKFSKSVDLLPTTLTHIKFGYSFDNPVDNLPYNLEWLEFGHSFNQQVNMLPHTITYLVFGDLFNQQVDDLPNLIEYISFGKNFNKSLNCLPDSIVFINIGNLNDIYPKISSTHFDQFTSKLPNNLNNLVIYYKEKKYPIKNNFIYQLNNLVCKLLL